MAGELSRDEAIFNEAVEITPPQERAAFLDRACAGDEDLRRRVESLLAAHEGATDVLRLPGSQRTLKPFGVASEGAGATIGRYKLLEQIGEGGFGAVFMAEQQHPVRRKVAFKIIKLGMDTKQVIARFEAERQALAMMDHPNIAHVLDAGATASGRPYFVMELVRGVPITEYCDKHQLPPRERSASTSGVFRGDGNTITAIARRGQAAPGAGGGTFSGFNIDGDGPSINDTGQVAFRGYLVGRSDGSTSGIFRGDGSSITPIARERQSLLDGTGAFISGFPNSTVASISKVNNAGQVAFNADTAGGINGNYTAMMRSDGGALVTIARSGQMAPGEAAPSPLPGALASFTTPRG
jgi:hypothetical protein